MHVEPVAPLLSLDILLVDDEPVNLAVLERLLARSGYTSIRTAASGGDALDTFGERPPDLVLLDLHMPGMDGFEVMARIRERISEAEYLPILVITADLDPDVRARALSLGATDFVTKPFEAVEVLLRIRNLLQTRHLHTRLQRYNEELETRVRERTAELEEAQLEILARLALAAEYRDDQTGQHAQRVGVVAGLLARELGLDAGFAELLRQAAPLHDVGKIGVPDSILLKAGKLTADEFEVMRSHVDIGGSILDGSRFAVLRLAREVALSHHERWDGTGYRGLAGDAIPLSGRIVAVADVFDSLRHERPYKGALPLEEVVREVVAGRGSHFDPAVVDAFLRLLDRGALRWHGLAPAEAGSGGLDAPAPVRPENEAALPRAAPLPIRLPERSPRPS